MKLNSDMWQVTSGKNHRTVWRDPMTPRHVSPVTCHQQRGVALVITLIMLAVITFMAVTFLAVSRREAGSVTVTRDQTTARLAAEGTLERVKAEILAGILGSTNAFNFDLLVSTNYLSAVGYNPAAQTIGVPNVTNVNYRYANGNPITGNDALQNLANLLYNARPPVFITNRLFANSNDFRYYLDLNRNGRYDTNGVWPEINRLGFPVTYTSTNGNTVTNYLYFVGDPEWIGVLERPDRPHSATNRFVARYAYIVVPSGKTLDVNFVHNQAKQPNPAADGFLRNQGVGSWEINLAGFLVDLNTNYWQSDLTYGSPYIYLPQGLSSGAAFDDAMSLVRYRYAGNYRNTLPFVANLFGNQGVNAFNRDFYDGYSGGPLMTNYWGWNLIVDQDQAQSRPLKNWWPGGDSFNHFFTTQDFFDRKKAAYPGTAAPFVPWTFPDRLFSAGTNISSYDRYTFYRLLSQLGTDSATEPADKINLNYDNLVQKNPVTGVASATNFYQWEPTAFFTNVAHKLLVEYSGEWLNANSNVFFASYRTNQPFGVTNIPVWVNSNFVYSPSLHRLLQLAANICDAMTNRTSTYGADLPSVFRPVFGKQGNDVYITGYTSVERVSGSSDPVFSIPRDLKKPADVTALQPNDNVYGVPWVIGAKKGFPNFNEFAMQAVVQITRKLQVRRPDTRPSLNDPRWQTNMLYIVGISNVVALEAWNSYRSNYSRAVDLYVTDDLAMTLTNNLGYGRTTNVSLPRVLSIPQTGPQQWKGYQVAYPTNSFRVPLRENVVFQYDSAYKFVGQQFTTNWDTAWDNRQPPPFELPQWQWLVSNKLRFIMLDPVSQRVVDYVQLDGPNTVCDISAEIQKPLQGKPPAFADLWSTNRLASGLPIGINNQLLVSLGDPSSAGTTEDWSDYGKGNPTGANKEFAIDFYRAMYGLSPLFQHRGGLPPNTNLVQQVPFSPTARVAQYVTWQANDPLVHYTPGDLQYLALTNGVERPSVKEDVDTKRNIGDVNGRYQPWGGNPAQSGGGQNTRTDPNAYNAAVKDPLMRSSDDWSFPTNKFPNIGWLGRVHRGTPWQTVYMKSFEITEVPNGVKAWQNWSGNGNVFSLNPTNFVLDATRSAPASDRILFDLFTTAFNENATRGQLSVNQSGLAAWSAVFAGVQVLSNNASDAGLNVLRLQPNRPLTNFAAFAIEPAGTGSTNSPLWKIVEGINRERNRVIGTNAAGEPVFAHPGQTFRHVGDVLAVPELSTNSPFLNQNSLVQVQNGINDAVYEWLPQQVMSLLQVGEPRFAVYSYGQTLRPAPGSIVTSGTFQGLCTNYQVTAEVATRAVLRLEGSPDPSKTDTILPPAKRYPPRVVIEKFNLLPPD